LVGKNRLQNLEYAKERFVYGSGGFGNIRSEMRMTFSAMSIISIIIRSNMDWFVGLKIGRGQHITDMSEKDFTAEVMILRKLLKLTLRLLENNNMVGQAPPYKLMTTFTITGAGRSIFSTNF